MAGVTEPDWDHLADGNARQARKRVAVDVLIRDDQDRVLLVNPTYKDFWDLPGGMAEANEPPRAAAERELWEELRLSVPLGRMLALDWVGPHGPWDDQLILVFDGGVLEATRTTRLTPADPEIAELTFADRTDITRLLRDDMARRTERARAALADGTTAYAERP
ncbi:NUDIX domain-containing protein [Saccharomonospora iraqiensis]|uniref:NUDIX domain-containing protein n=1 Tax=Saccharomonospora iraqiensis TaxID=52698 RepID=UPI00022DE994|nr:NUDIX hydrolase [Saccharomonospora iraqiensis]